MPCGIHPAPPTEGEMIALEPQLTRQRRTASSCHARLVPARCGAWIIPFTGRSGSASTGAATSRYSKIFGERGPADPHGFLPGKSLDGYTVPPDVSIVRISIDRLSRGEPSARNKTMVKHLTSE
jgi:hypothetical protein